MNKNNICSALNGTDNSDDELKKTLSYPFPQPTLLWTQTLIASGLFGEEARSTLLFS